MKRTAWLILFAVAMGFLEASVVVYLRELYYPNGFTFPLVLMPARVAGVEIAREAATLVMLLAVAMVAGRTATSRFFTFAFLFGVWDLVYYVALRVLVSWPLSVWEWDVLFLIPVPWLAPVLYPALVSGLFIGGYAVHEWLEREARPFRPRPLEWIVATLGALAVIVAFCWNWRIVTESGVPTSFPAPLFWTGILAGTIPLALAAVRSTRATRS